MLLSTGSVFSFFETNATFSTSIILCPFQHLRAEIEFFIDNLLVRTHLIIEMIWRTGLAPWETWGKIVWRLQGYLAHKKPPPPPRTTIGP